MAETPGVMPTWKRSGGTCFLLRRLWTCSVALLEKGCGARWDHVTLGRRDKDTGARQGCTSRGTHGGTPIPMAGSVAPTTGSVVVLELPLKTPGARLPQPTLGTPPLSPHGGHSMALTWEQASSSFMI